jgi:hypothetical protein
VANLELAVMVHTCNPLYSGRQEDLDFKASLGKVGETLNQKQNANKRAERVVR